MTPMELHTVKAKIQERVVIVRLLVVAPTVLIVEQLLLVLAKIIPMLMADTAQVLTARRGHPVTGIRLVAHGQE